MNKLKKKKNKLKSFQFAAEFPNNRQRFVSFTQGRGVRERGGCGRGVTEREEVRKRGERARRGRKRGERSRYSRSLKRMIWAVNISINYFVTTFKIYIH